MITATVGGVRDGYQRVGQASGTGVTEALDLDGLDQSGTTAAAASRPSADPLLEDEESAADTGYQGRLTVIGGIRAAGVARTVLVLVAPIAAQIGLARRFRRTVNPLMALSTVRTLVFGVRLFSGLEEARDSYVTQRAGATGVSWENEAYGADMADMKASDSRRLLDLEQPGPAGAAAATAEQARSAADLVHVTNTSSPEFVAYPADAQRLRLLATAGRTMPKCRVRRTSISDKQVGISQSTCLISISLIRSVPASPPRPPRAARTPCRPGFGCRRRGPR